jgi:tight adherence protein C
VNAIGLMLGAAAGALFAAGIGGLVARPTRRLGPRVRPYTVVARAALGRSADVGPTARPRGAAPGPHRLVRSARRGALARLGRLVDSRSDDAISLRLRQAGLAGVTPDEYRLQAAAQTALFTTAGALPGLLIGSPVVTLALAACAFGVGVTRRRARIDAAISERRERIRLELYTLNQLLAMHLRTGAGPVQATQRIVDRGTGVMVEELDSVLGWIHSGMAEPAAFRRAAELTPEPNAARTYKLFAAGAERGADLGIALRALSEDLRDARREDLRRSATRRRAAMLIPTIVVLAPIMLLFVAAPLPSIVFAGQ